MLICTSSCSNAINALALFDLTISEFLQQLFKQFQIEYLPAVKPTNTYFTLGLFLFHKTFLQPSRQRYRISPPQLWKISYFIHKYLVWYSLVFRKNEWHNLHMNLVFMLMYMWFRSKFVTLQLQYIWNISACFEVRPWGICNCSRRNNEKKPNVPLVSLCSTCQREKV